MNYINRTVSAAIIFIITAGQMLFSQAGGTKAEKSAELKTFSGIEMVLIPGNDKISQFYIGKYEVTQKYFESVMGFNPCEFKGKPDNPVESVSWYHSVDFCNKLSEKAGFKPYYKIDKTVKDPDNKNADDYIKWKVSINEGADGFRLPTSAEWEYACRAGTSSTYYWGESSQFSVVNEYEVYSENSFNKWGQSDYGTHAVGTKKPNPLGLYDMLGNVREFCYDWHPSFIGSTRVQRGGGWPNDAFSLRAEDVNDFSPHYGHNSLGFRVAKNK